MRKTHIIILFFLVFNNSFCQTSSDVSGEINKEEFKFQSVEKSMKLIKIHEINKFQIIDTITQPEAYLIRNFDNHAGTISIAIKSNEEFKVYEILSENAIFNNHVVDTVNAKKISNPYIIEYAPQFKIKELKRIKLDKFDSEELIIKFSCESVYCPHCNQSQAVITNGYLIFDFDKLQFLKLINFKTTTLSQRLKYLDNAENFKIDLKKNYVKIKKRKYYYNHDKLTSK